MAKKPEPRVSEPNPPEGQAGQEKAPKRPADLDRRPEVKTSDLPNKVRLCLRNDHSREHDGKEVELAAGTVVFEVALHDAFMFEDLLSALNRGTNFVAPSDHKAFRPPRTT